MISYAQNLEDVVLNRVFKNKDKGFYIDVGAHDPVELSVTKHFYDLGWRGINIEPVFSSHAKIEKERKRDINLNIALGRKEENLTIHEVERRPDLSSFDKDTVEAIAQKLGAGISSYSVEVRTLKEICRTYCDEHIDFLKIDVEGYEKNVIQGADWKKYRPTILVIESTVPNMCVIEDWESAEIIENWSDWESIILKAGYILVYYDGLNRYYVRKEDEHLKNHFYIPITPLQDRFEFFEQRKKINTLNDLREGLKRTNQELERKTIELNKMNIELEQRNVELNQKHEELERRNVELNQKHEELEQRNVDLSQMYEELERKYAELNQKYGELEQRHAELNRKYVWLEKKNAELKQMNSVSERKNADLDRHINILRALIEEERFLKKL